MKMDSTMTKEIEKETVTEKQKDFAMKREKAMETETG